MSDLQGEPAAIVDWYEAWGLVVVMKATITGVGFVMRYSSRGAKIRVMGYECTIDGISIILRSLTVSTLMHVNNKRFCL